MEIVDAPYRKLPRLKNYDYSSPGAYFVTICTRLRDQNVLCCLEAVGAAAPGGPSVAVRLTEAGTIVDELIRRIGPVYSGVHVDTYCIMPDHVHLLLVIRAEKDGPPGAAAPTADFQASGSGRTGPVTIPKIINSLKSLSTRRCGQALWQRGYYERVVRCEQELNEIRDYIELNPRKKYLINMKDL